jgi:hypothetical protein
MAKKKFKWLELYGHESESIETEIMGKCHTLHAVIQMDFCGCFFASSHKIPVKRPN